MNPYTILYWLFLFGLLSAIYNKSHEIFICIIIVVLLHVIGISMYTYTIDSARSNEINFDEY